MNLLVFKRHYSKKKNWSSVDLFSYCEVLRGIFYIVVVDIACVVSFTFFGNYKFSFPLISTHDSYKPTYISYEDEVPIVLSNLSRFHSLVLHTIWLYALQSECKQNWMWKYSILIRFFFCSPKYLAGIIFFSHWDL